MNIYTILMSMASFVICMAVMTAFEMFNVWNISDRSSEDYIQSVLSMTFYSKVLAFSCIVLVAMLAAMLLFFDNPTIKF